MPIFIVFALARSQILRACGGNFRTNATNPLIVLSGDIDCKVSSRPALVPNLLISIAGSKALSSSSIPLGTSRSKSTFRKCVTLLSFCFLGMCIRSVRHQAQIEQHLAANLGLYNPLDGRK